MEESVQNKSVLISASLLAAKITELGAEANSVVAAGANWLHLDIMDNHFVPNLSFGPDLCSSLRQSGINVPLDVHLMLQPVTNMVERFAASGADYISFHSEAVSNVGAVIQQIKQHSCKAGLVLKPSTSLEVLNDCAADLDLVLIMSVEPGFAGQSFLPNSTQRIIEAREILQNKNSTALLQVDGGVNLTNASDIVAAGADVLVVGSAIFHSQDYATSINTLRLNCKLG